MFLLAIVADLSGWLNQVIGSTELLVRPSYGLRQLGLKSKIVEEATHGDLSHGFISLSIHFLVLSLIKIKH